MIHSPEYLRTLLDKALTLVAPPRKFGAIIEGSIAAGFGNESSDIDFLLIADSEQNHPMMPTIVFVDGRRVEVRVLSLGQLRRRAEELRAHARGGPRRIARLPDNRIDRYQRLHSGFALLGHDVVARARAFLPDDELRPIVETWFAGRARQAARYAMAVHVLRRDADAVTWIQFALSQGAKAWVARHGETYLERKWLTQQMARVPDPDGLAARYTALTERDAPLDDADLLRESHALLAAFGVGGCGYRPEAVQLTAGERVTTWQIGSRVHIIRQDRDVFVLSRDAALVWRSLVFEVPLPHILERAPGGPEGAGPVIAEFSRLGLVRFTWRRSPIAAPPSATPTPVRYTPMVTPVGARRGGDAGVGDYAGIELLPLPADRFAGIGMALVWHNMILENAREDLVGAIQRGQWGTASVTAQRMFRQTCLALLLSYGNHGIVAEESPVVIERSRQVPEEFRQLVADTRGLLAVEDAESAHRVLDVLDSFAARIREGTAAGLFPSCFVSADEWRQTLEMGYDWVRLGAYLDVAPPIEDARDLIASGGDQPIVRAAAVEQAR